MTHDASLGFQGGNKKKVLGTNNSAGESDNLETLYNYRFALQVATTRVLSRHLLGEFTSKFPDSPPQKKKFWRTIFSQVEFSDNSGNFH
jgi:hypothetical protein